MSSRSQLADRIRKLRGGVSQAEFAAAVGVPPSRVSESESGKTPSFEMRFLLGLFAIKQKRHEDARFFLRDIGLNDLHVLSHADGIRKTRTAKARPGDLVRVRLSEKAASEKEQAGSPAELLFPASMIPAYVDPTYVRIGSDFQQFRRGDVLLIDESESNLLKLEGERIAYLRRDDFLTAEYRRYRGEVTKHLTEWQLKEALEHGQTPFEHVGVFSGWLRMESGMLMVDAPSRLLGNFIRRQVGIVAEGGVVMSGDLIMLGRVLAWFGSSDSIFVKRGGK